MTSMVVGGRVVPNKPLQPGRTKFNETGAVHMGVAENRNRSGKVVGFLLVSSKYQPKSVDAPCLRNSQAWFTGA